MRICIIRALFGKKQLQPICDVPHQENFANDRELTPQQFEGVVKMQAFWTKQAKKVYREINKNG